MHGGRRKCRQAHGNILGALRTRGAVPDPLSARGHDGLSGADLMDGGFGFDAKQPAKDDRVLVKFWCLSRLGPARWALHPCDTDLGGLTVDQPEELLNELGFGPCRLNNGRTLDLDRHAFPPNAYFSTT